MTLLMWPPPTWGKRSSCPADKPCAEESLPILCNAHSMGQIVPPQKGAPYLPCDVLSDWHVALVQLSMMSRSGSQTSEHHHQLVQPDQWIFLGHILLCLYFHILVLLETNRNTTLCKMLFLLYSLYLIIIYLLLYII